MNQRICLCLETFFSTYRNVNSPNFVDGDPSRQTITFQIKSLFFVLTTAAFQCSYSSTEMIVSTLWRPKKALHIVSHLETKCIKGTDGRWKPKPSDHFMVCVLGNVCDSRVDLEGLINGKYQGETRLRKHVQSGSRKMGLCGCWVISMVSNLGSS